MLYLFIAFIMSSFSVVAMEEKEDNTALSFRVVSFSGIYVNVTAKENTLDSLRTAIEQRFGDQPNSVWLFDRNSQSKRGGVFKTLGESRLEDMSQPIPTEHDLSFSLGDPGVWWKMWTELTNTNGWSLSSSEDPYDLGNGYLKLIDSASRSECETTSGSRSD